MSSFKFEAWPTEYRAITQYFGANPQYYSQFGLPGHDGLDLQAPTGSKVYSVAPGRVKLVVRDPKDHNYGRHIRITHAEGYETIYAHLEKPLVKEGNRVEAGTLIGLADSSGNSTGSHLHLTLKRKGVTKQGWPGNIIDPTPFLLPLLAWRKPAGPYTEGWVCTASITMVGDLAQVSSGDAYLKNGPGYDAEVIDLIPAGTMLIIIGEEQDDFIPVQVPTLGLASSPALTPPPEPDPDDLSPPEEIVFGWAWADYLDITGHYAMVGRHGVYLRGAPKIDSEQIGQIQWGYMVTLIGLSVNGYAPIFAYEVDVVDYREPKKAVQEPKPFPRVDNLDAGTISGWVLTAQVHADDTNAVVGRIGVNLRDAPRRNGNLMGYLPLGTNIMITGPRTGEFTPVRLRERDIQEPAPQQDPPLPDPDPEPLGQVMIGMHAAADPDITDEEIIEFTQFRPGVIKLLSFHDPAAVRQLADNHPNAKWIVRAFLDFGHRSISPQQFFNFTVSDMRRTLDILKGREVAIELHNEPNVLPEGLGDAWKDGNDFSTWWLRLLRLYRYVFPDHKFIYPGLSPGTDIYNYKHDHIRFIEASRAAVDAADGLGIHLYWSAFQPMNKALDVLDDMISRFRSKPIWVTEASNNKSGTAPTTKANQYLTFWKELQKRPLVRGVTYFVASARDSKFDDEVIVGKGMSRIIGSR
ncbi:MAG: M23 family metallopeptidase [Candidatus Promineifilaceae bacterium]|nr:M23 family metallopeptidase [Candidatus Promineifilaceae bacterium]